MQKIVSQLQSKKLIYKKLEEIQPSTLNIRNKIRIFHTLDLSSRYGILFVVSQKSRIMQKNVAIFESIVEKVKIYVDHNVINKVIIIDAPLCSKAKALFKENRWKVIDATV